MGLGSWQNRTMSKAAGAGYATGETAIQLLDRLIEKSAAEKCEQALSKLKQVNLCSHVNTWPCTRQQKQREGIVIRGKMSPGRGIALLMVVF